MFQRLFGRNRSTDGSGQQRDERGGFIESILEMLGVDAGFDGDDDGERSNNRRRRRRRDDEDDSVDF
jgi:hypothetical protein